MAAECLAQGCLNKVISKEVELYYFLLSVHSMHLCIFICFRNLMLHYFNIMLDSIDKDKLVYPHANSMNWLLNLCAAFLLFFGDENRFTLVLLSGLVDKNEIFEINTTFQFVNS